MIYVSPNKNLFIDFNFVLIVNFVNCSVFVHICLNMSLSLDVMKFLSAISLEKVSGTSNVVKRGALCSQSSQCIIVMKGREFLC